MFGSLLSVAFARRPLIARPLAAPASSSCIDRLQFIHLQGNYMRQRFKNAIMIRFDPEATIFCNATRCRAGSAEILGSANLDPVLCIADPQHFQIGAPRRRFASIAPVIEMVAAAESLSPIVRCSRRLPSLAHKDPSRCVTERIDKS